MCYLVSMMVMMLLVFFWFLKNALAHSAEIFSDAVCFLEKVPMLNGEVLSFHW